MNRLLFFLLFFFRPLLFFFYIFFWLDLFVIIFWKGLFVIRLSLALDYGCDGIGNRLGLDLVFIPARGIIGIRSGRRPLDGRLGHAHDLVGDAVGFLLVFVVRRADLEFGLQGCTARAAAPTGACGCRSNYIQIG